MSYNLYCMMNSTHLLPCTEQSNSLFKHINTTWLECHHIFCSQLLSQSIVHNSPVVHRALHYCAQCFTLLCTKLYVTVHKVLRYCGQSFKLLCTKLYVIGDKALPYFEQLYGTVHKALRYCEQSFTLLSNCEQSFSLCYCQRLEGSTLNFNCLSLTRFSPGHHVVC